MFEDVIVEVKTLVVPEGGELPPEEELAAMEAAEAEAAGSGRRRRPRRTGAEAEAVVEAELEAEEAELEAEARRRRGARVPSSPSAEAEPRTRADEPQRATRSCRPRRTSSRTVIHSVLHRAVEPL